MHMLMKHSDEVMIFNLVGDLTGGSSCDCITGDFRSLVSSGCSHFVVNFAHVRLINSHGISCLVGVKTIVELVGGKLVLCCLEPRNLSTIYRMRLQEVFEIEDNLQNALGAVAPALQHPV